MTQPFREFTTEQIEAARFFHLRICTSGVDNPEEGDEAYDYTYACPECKAGRQVKGKLNIKPSKMGKKKLDMNFRYGFLVFESDLADKIRTEELKGIEFRSCSLGTDQLKFKEGSILNTFPKFAQNTIIHKENVCQTCKKSGHYDAQAAPTEFWYNKSDLNLLSDDFYLSWEYYGIWNLGQSFPLLIVSQMFRNLLTAAYKLRHLRFEPIQEQE
jgi:hypothetical protein